MAFPRPRIGVSACLLGQEVRYDGGHRLDGFISGSLSRFADLLPVCPEVAVGLGVPRPPIRLEGDPRRPHALVSDDQGLDLTERLERFAGRQAAGLSGICGYVFKSASPSCGMRGVRVLAAGRGPVIGEASGVYARVLMERLPDLPVEEEGRLCDPALRDSFLTRVFAYHRWLALMAQGGGARGLAPFHADHRYLIMARSVTALDHLDRLLSGLSRADLDVSRRRYIRGLMETLTRPADRAGHANVLRGILAELAQDRGSALVDAVESFRRGEVPWMVPAALLRHHLLRHPERDTALRRYLQPYPDELALPDVT